MTEKEGRPEETPLESWKEIAAYLKRDVRTVMRWEKAEALPVRRHLHQERSTVYAYPIELDAWWATRQPLLEAAASHPRAWQRVISMPALGLVAVLLLALGSVGSGVIVTEGGAGADEPGSGAAARQVWAGPEVDLEGSVSPDGRYLTFVDWSTGDLALRDLATGKNRRLTNKGPWEESSEYAEVSAPSPDGQQIAYAWFNGDNYDLRLVKLDGSAPRVLYRSEEVDYLEPGAWSPDGKLLVATFTTAEKTNQIALVSVADGSVRILKSTDWRHPHVGSFSPDGGYVVYDFPPEEDSPQRDIFLLAIDGSRETRLVEHPSNDRVLGWTPDGQGILFSSDRTGPKGAWLLWMVEGKAQGNPTLLRPGLGQFGPLGFTQEGAFYYGVAAGVRDAYVVPFDPVTLRLAADPKPISPRYEGANRVPVYSRDGRFLAYLSQRSPLPEQLGSPTLVIRDLSTGQEREHSLRLNHEPPHSPPCWSADGQFVFLEARDKKGRHGIFQIDVQTGAAVPFVLSERKRVVHKPAATPDGKALLYLVADREPEQIRLVRRELQTGREKTLLTSGRPYLVNNLAISPDGRWVAFPRFDQKSLIETLNILPLGGGDPREVFKQQVEKDHNISGKAGLAWTPDSAYLLFGRWRDYAASQLIDVSSVPVAGGEPRKLGLTAERLWGLRLHPNGRELAFTGGDSKPEVWVLENFLPALKAAKQ